MYKYLLCWRYLRTRYIALASIVSVMLGVATMIVVNGVMAGFSEKMRDRLHGVLADVVVESWSLDGFHDYQTVIQVVREAGGDDIVAMAPTLETPAMLSIPVGDATYPKPVQLIGIRPEERSMAGDFAEYLIGQDGKKIPPSFEVSAALKRRSPAGVLLEETDPDDPFARIVKQHADEAVPDQGIIIGYALATVHQPGTKRDHFIAEQGTKVILSFPTAGRKPDVAHDDFTVVGYSKSGMSEYDSMHVFVPLERLQQLRRCGDAINQIQIKARKGADLDKLAERLQTALERVHPMFFRVATWEQKQGPLLAAVTVEQNILNLLLFFIIAVAGFGILAIFSMIVVEKTRDIGILKALGASTSGVRGIFLGYGLSLGLVGSGVGMLGGLAFIHYINDIEAWLSALTGRKVFDDTIYYFDSIPTLIEPWTVAWIVGGALLIAVAASVWPAQRASKLHPVRALRYE